MGIVINENDVGLNDLAGLALTYTTGHDLPNDIYIYGLQNGRPYQVYIDSQLRHAEKICHFARRVMGIRCVVGLPTNPRMRPAIGMIRSFRTDHIEQATRLAVFACFAANHRVRFTMPEWDIRVGDMVRFNAARGTVVAIRGNDVIVKYADHDQTLRVPGNYLSPLYPDAVGQLIRPIQSAPTYGNGAYRIHGLNEENVGTITQLEEDRWWATFTYAYDGYSEYYVDPGQFIRVNTQTGENDVRN